MEGSSSLRFAATRLTSEERSLQAEVRAFLADELGFVGYRPGLGMNAAADREFSRKLGRRGWLGMSLPKEYGGAERTAVDRFIVTAELLRRGAPVGHHWLADRQSGAMINRYGTEEQKRRYLPGICAGELAFSVGMSEPDAGSDLASVQTRAVREGEGWIINGTKMWTTGAQRSDAMITLCRTSDSGEKHKRLSQFILDLRLPGVSVRPIRQLDGSADFNEVVLSDVRVGEDALLGDLGEGWSQNTDELVLERGGPDRFLSTYPVFESFLYAPEATRLDERGLLGIGRLVARYWVLFHMSMSMARAVDGGESPVEEAALIKEYGTRFEQEVVATVLDLSGLDPITDSGSTFERVLAEAILTNPLLTIRGGTIEILRSVAAKGLVG